MMLNLCNSVISSATAKQAAHKCQIVKTLLTTLPGFEAMGEQLAVNLALANIKISKEKLGLKELLEQLLSTQKDYLQLKEQILKLEKGGEGLPREVIGKTVTHVKFGVGQVIGYDKKALLEVQFGTVTKKLDAITCLEKASLQFEDCETAELVKRGLAPALEVHQLRSRILEAGFKVEKLTRLFLRILCAEISTKRKALENAKQAQAKAEAALTLAKRSGTKEKLEAKTKAVTALMNEITNLETLTLNSMYIANLYKLHDISLETSMVCVALEIGKYVLKVTPTAQAS